MATPATQPFQSGDSNRSLTDGITLGHAGTRPVRLTLDQISGVHIGAAGTGKTVLLHNVIARVAETTDATVFVADLEMGGALAAPWLHQQANNKVSYSPVDWIATDVPEAERMADRLHREFHARRLNELIPQVAKDHTARRLIPSNATPAVVVLVALPPRWFHESAVEGVVHKFQHLQRVGAPVNIYVIFSASSSRGRLVPDDHGDFLGHTLVSSRNRDDLDVVFGSIQPISRQSMPAPGQFVIRHQGLELPDTFAVPFIHAQEISTIVEETEERHPDNALTDLGDPSDSYDGRWGKTGATALLFALRD